MMRNDEFFVLADFDAYVYAQERDVYKRQELDWYTNDNLKGISLGLVVNGELSASDGSSVEITDEKMQMCIRDRN